jgi:hypothetical protein
MRDDSVPAIEVFSLTSESPLGGGARGPPASPSVPGDSMIVEIAHGVSAVGESVSGDLDGEDEMIGDSKVTRLADSRADSDEEGEVRLDILREERVETGGGCVELVVERTEVKVPPMESHGENLSYIFEICQ